MKVTCQETVGLIFDCRLSSARALSLVAGLPRHGVLIGVFLHPRALSLVAGLPRHSVCFFAMSYAIFEIVVVREGRASRPNNSVVKERGT